MSEDDLFDAAIQIPNAAARADFLQRECPDSIRRKDIEELIAAHFSDPAVLDRPQTMAMEPPDSTLPSKDSQTGIIVAQRYKLLERIGEGGMGEVWMADQLHPVRRRVAIKLIKAGMDSRQVQARFEAERQALAMMDHPNIAKVLDGGVFESRPYFVMELVKGIPITEYCDARRLTPQQRLELFIPVCQAIQHAHQKGVIHRDIKPTNVLIALYDDRPVPKVIDFGVAKATTVTLTEHTLNTGFGGIVGTPHYMSPEQATFNNLDIDTRSDIYSLGVLLYELLTGSTPFTRKELERKGLLEILRVVREEEPPKPSTKLSTAEALPTLSANRGTEPKKLTALLRNDLDWIVLKALEKDRARRYETANGFAADINRYLSGEPVLAHPPTAGYRLKKFLRKNSTFVNTAALCVWIILLSTVYSGYQMSKTASANKLLVQGLGLLEDANKDLRQAKAAEEAQRKLAQEQQRLAEHRAASVTVDAASYRLEGPLVREAMLRLAQTLKSIPVDAVELRQHVRTRLLLEGQRIAPLYPPFPAQFSAIRADGRVGISCVDDTWTAWDLITGKSLAELGGRRTAFSIPYDTTRGRFAGFSTEGRTAFTVHGPSGPHVEVNVWDCALWNRVATIRPGQGAVTAAALNRDGTRLLTIARDDRFPAQIPTEQGIRAELWDLPTGRLIGHLNHDGEAIALIQFDPDGTRCMTVTDRVVRCWSAADGSRLFECRDHPQPVHAAEFSPNGRWIATYAGAIVTWWNATTGQREGVPVDVPYDAKNANGDEFVIVRFLSNEAVTVRAWNIHGVSFGATVASALCLRGEAQSLKLDVIGSDGHYALTTDGTVYQLRPYRRVPAPPGRQSPPEAVRAAGSRFIQIDSQLYDVVAEKNLGQYFHRPRSIIAPCRAKGIAAWIESSHRWQWEDCEMLVPAAELAIPDEVLILWTEVLTRSRIDRETGFVTPVDEATWEVRRQELLQCRVDTGEFPFPGPFAADRLYWLRQEVETGRTDDPAKLNRINRLLAAEPTWEHYLLRANHWNATSQSRLAILDAMEANRLCPGTLQRGQVESVGTVAAKAIMNHDRASPADLETALDWYRLPIHARVIEYDPYLIVRRAALQYRLNRPVVALAELYRLEMIVAAQVSTWALTPFAGAVVNHAAIDLAASFRNEPEPWIIEALCLKKLGREEPARAAISRALVVVTEKTLNWSRNFENIDYDLRSFGMEIRTLMPEAFPQQPPLRRVK